VSDAFDAVLPDPDKMLRDKGHRLHVSFDGLCSYVEVYEERVWPERIDNPDANALEVTDRIILHRDGIQWLRDQLDAVLAKIAAGEGAPT
jgi:hypothetical protein